MARIATLARIAAALLALAASCPAAEPGREEVLASAAAHYARRLADYNIDTDPNFASRVRSIALPLIAQARRDYPDSSAWAWEIHTTDDERQNADAMAGGKILLSQPYVERLQLNDAELAMLLAHEIAHAALQHNYSEYLAAIRLDPSWAQRPFAELEHAVDHDRELMAQLSGLNYHQEQEADGAGMRLAWRAGWPATQLAGYFRKMMRATEWPRRSKGDYPSPTQRWYAAQAVARSLQKNHVQPGD